MKKSPELTPDFILIQVLIELETIEEALVFPEKLSIHFNALLAHALISFADSVFLFLFHTLRLVTDLLILAFPFFFTSPILKVFHFQVLLTFHQKTFLIHHILL